MYKNGFLIFVILVCCIYCTTIQAQKRFTFCIGIKDYPATRLNVTILANDKPLLRQLVRLPDSACIQVPLLPNTLYECITGEGDNHYEPIRFSSDSLRSDSRVYKVFSPRITALKEVIVKNDKPYYKGDTLIIPVDSIKTRPHAPAAELLNKVPGVDVGVNGEVKVNGKKVDEITVNGQNLFGGNAKATLEALKGDMIQQLEVLERENSSGERTPSLNLKLKKGRSKGWYGDIGANAGSGQTYRGDLRLNYIKPGLFFNSFMNTNNLNERALSEQSLYSFTNSFKKDITAYSITEQQSQGSMVVSKAGDDNLFENAANQFGINNSLTGGISLSHGLKKGSLEAFALAEKNRKDLRQDYFSTLFIQPLIQRDTAISNEYAQRSTVYSSIMLGLNPNTRNTVKLSQSFRYVNEEKDNAKLTRTLLSDAGDTPLANNLVTSNSANSNQRLGVTTQAMWLHRWKKSAKVFSIYTRYDFEKQDGSFNYINLGSRLGNNNQNLVRKTQKHTADLQAVQSFPLSKKILLEGRFNGHYDNSIIEQDAMSYDSASRKYSNFLPALSAAPLSVNNLRTQLLLNGLYKKQGFSLVTGLGFYYWQSQRHRSGRKLALRQQPLLLPFLLVRKKMKSGKLLLLSYRPGWDVPTTEQLNPVADSSNIQQVRFGNPQLDGAFKQTASASFSFTGKQGSVLSATLQYLHINDPVVAAAETQSSGFTSNSFVQFGRTRQLSSSLFWLNFNASRPYNIFASAFLSHLESYAVTNKTPFRYRSTFGLMYIGSRWKITKKMETDLRLQTSYNRYSSPQGSRSDFRNTVVARIENALPGEFYSLVDANIQFNGANNPNQRINPFVRLELSKYFGKNNRCKISTEVRNLFNTDNAVTFSQTTTQQFINRFNTLPRVFNLGLTLYFDKWTGKD